VTVKAALARAPVLVAADGGADRALAAGVTPDAVIGDLDSLTAAARAALPPDRLHLVGEQETTDFEKCLTRIRAPYVLGAGFTGGRMDHALAVWNTLVRVPAPPCLILSQSDVVFAAPLRLELALPPGTRVSLFPMAAVRGVSEGLAWPIAGIDFAPDGRVGTSNRATGPVRLEFDRRGMLAMLPRACLDAAIGAVAGG
jgi:thiamine pyrophosphokinase